MRSLKSKPILATAAVALIIVGAGVYYASDSQASKAPVQQAQAVPVIVQTVAKQKVRVWSDFSGRLHAVDAAEIRPEVSGRITEIRFEDGAQVKKGDVLLVIDPRPYQAAVAKAEANLATAKTNADFAKLESGRANTLLKTQAIAQRVFDERANAERVANASVKAADAELKQVNLDLEHAYVRAPISGRVSRAELTVGNLVQAGPNAPLLTSVVANGDIYADFEVDEQTYMQSIRNIANDHDHEREIAVEMSVQGDKGHSYKGTIYSFDNRIDPASGTIRARAKFSNTDGVLVPGMFVSVNLANGNESEALLVPESALGFDQSKQYVFVVGKDNKVAYREVTLGKEVNGKRIVLSGLEPGERIIVEGMQHVRPEAIVDAKELAEISPAAGKDANGKDTPLKK